MKVPNTGSPAAEQVMQPTQQWDEATVQSYIDNRVQENIHLDYKVCDSLQKTEGKKREVGRDTSSFANSDGGTIIYGVKEDQRTHEPTKMDEGYDPTEISHEWLDQVINSNVQPRIDGLRIVPVHLSGPNAGRVLYVVDIPKATTTAYQASDKRYYKRFNFESVPMEHYEIIDVLNRSQTPDLHVTLSLVDVHGTPVALQELQFQLQQDHSQPFHLHISVRNKAVQPAHHFALKLFVDDRLSVIHAQRFIQASVPAQLMVGTAQLPVKVLAYNLHPAAAMPIFGDDDWNVTEAPIQLAVPLAGSNRSHQYPVEYVLASRIIAPGMAPKFQLSWLRLISGSLHGPQQASALTSDLST